MAQIKNFTYVLSALQRIQINRVGDFVRCIDAQAAFNIQPINADEVEIQEGVGVKFDEVFDSFYLINGSTAQTVTIYIGVGEVQDSRFYGSVNALITPGSALDCPAHVAQPTADTDTIAANLSRRSITIGSLSTNSGVIFAGESGSTDATHGVEIQPGTNFRFETTAAVDIFNGSGATQTYWVLEES
jgi:hypothetical protein